MTILRTNGNAEEDCGKSLTNRSVTATGQVTLGLVDIYRVLHPKKKAFTYESKTLRLKSRIDFFLIAQSLKLNIRTAEIRSSIAPDHKAIYLSVEINDAFHRSPGTWKFNNQLLEDENFVQLITECLPRILAKYQEVESHQLLWELIKMEFRAETITYSKAKRRELKNRETYLQEKLDALSFFFFINLHYSTLQKKKKLDRHYRK